MIEYDEASEDTPIVIIDGKAYSWEEFGHMMMTYEEFQLQLKIFGGKNEE